MSYKSDKVLIPVVLHALQRAGILELYLPFL